MPTFIGTTANDSLIGSAGADFLDARDGNDLISGRGGSDTINTGTGSDIIAIDGDPFDGVDVSAPGRQFSGNEDFITDFSFALDSYQFDAADFRINGGLSFQSLDGTTLGASIRPGTNAIVLLNGDNDANPATPPLFNAGLAANQIASLVSTDGAGFFVYFNTALNVNRLVWSPNLNDATSDLKIVSRHIDLLSTNAVTALTNFTASNFRLAGESLTGGVGNDTLAGFGGIDTIDGGEGNDLIFGRGGQDTVTTGHGADIIAFDGEPFDGANISAPGRQFGGNEDFITDFDFAQDAYQFDAADFGITGGLSFQSLDGTAPGAAVRSGVNLIVLTNADDDGNTATAFNAGAAANQVANLVSSDGAGFFAYFNTALNVTRLVFSLNLNDPTADLKIVSRHTDLTGSAATGALGSFVASNFRFAGETLAGTAANDVLTGFGGADTISGGDGNDIINGRGGSDAITTGAGRDVLVFGGPVFDGVNVSAPGRQFSGNEDFITDFDFAQDSYRLDAADFAMTSPLSFQALDATAPGAAIRPGANLIILLNGDNDADPATAPVFNAGLAANQIASLTSTDGPGFFVYFNTALNINRLVYSPNLNDPTADLKIVSRHTDLTGGDAIAALALFNEANFRLDGETVSGTAADDTLRGGDGEDTLLGGAGNDVLDGGAGHDSMVGGLGDDTYVVDAAGDVVVEISDQGVDTVFVIANGWTAGPNIDTVYLYGDATSVIGTAGAEVLVSNGAFGSTLNGGAGQDTLWGQAGADRLLGGADADIIRGGGGNDTLNGGAGNDQLVGGDGADVFQYDAPAWGYDQIFDFVIGADKINLAGAATSFAQLTVLEAGGNTVVMLGGTDRIDVYGVVLTASDFLFG